MTGSMHNIMALSFCVATVWTVVMALGASAQGTFNPQFSYLLNCGSDRNTTTAWDGRTWVPDTTFHLAADSSFQASTPASTSSVLSASPFLLTARVFPAANAYTFSVSPASRYWLRLYFYPFQFDLVDLKPAVFSVVANGFTLLSDTDIASVIKSQGLTFVFKEFSIVSTSDTLKISFMPSTGSLAFVNALELTSMPSDIILDDSSPLGINAPKPLGMSFTSLECLHRVNVGGPSVLPINDSTNLYRSWAANESFLFSAAGVQNVLTDARSIVCPPPTPTYFAPRTVYSTALQMSDTGLDQNSFNISWVLPIEPLFRYMVRLHFCEIVYSSAGQRVFTVYLQNQTAYPSLDLVLSKQPSTVYYRDFTVDSAVGVDTLWIQVGPTPNAAVNRNNAILNGIEVWKVNNSDGSLSGVSTIGLRGSGFRTRIIPIALGVGVGSAFVAGIVLGFCCLCRKKAKVYKHSNSAWLPLPMLGGNSTSIWSKLSAGSHKSATGSYVSSPPTNLAKHFTLAELQEATKNFDESLVLGVGGFGKVYDGYLEDGTRVAIKRGNPSSEQGITEFQTEIEMLSKLRHRHLVSLIGYCEERCEMMLVYEYMANGPLRSHLYGSDLPQLSWKQRLEICIGAARGLHYLHTGAAQGIIHRDVKTTNILLDQSFVAKVSDFGLSKAGPTLDRTHVSTAVKGSFGYLDPEYFRRQQLTEKSDVYSFGVVLMEVLCARPAINPALPRDQVNIAEWAMHHQKTGMLESIIDPHLRGMVKKESLKKYGEIAEKCLADHGIYRPTMGDVLWNLEYALQLQETPAVSDLDDRSGSLDQILELPASLAGQGHWEMSTLDAGSMNSIVSEGDDVSEDATASAVFSQLVNPQGR